MQCDYHFPPKGRASRLVLSRRNQCPNDAEYHWLGAGNVKRDTCRAHTPRKERNPFTILPTRYNVKSVV